MNRSQNNTSSSPGGGFIYFNPKFLNKINQDQNKIQTSQNNLSDNNQDFLAFDNSPVQNDSPRHQGFSPSNFSSPKYNPHQSPYHYKKSPRGRGLHSSNNYSGNRPFYNSSRFDGSPNSSRNFGYNQRSWNKHGGHRGQDNALNSSNHNGNTSIFYDHTCVENPWLQLEKQLEEKTRKEKEESLKNEQSTEMTGQISEDSVTESSGEEDSSDEKEES